MMDNCMDEVIAFAGSMEINLGQEEKEAAWKWFYELPYASASYT